MSECALQVIKVGGSLLQAPDIRSRLNRWLDQNSSSNCRVLLAGGGAFADLIRDYDAKWQLGDNTSHWMCIDLMSVTARILTRLLPQARLLSQFSQLTSETACRRPRDLIVFDVAQFLQTEEASLPGTRLPHSWQSSSDSIAARLAEVLRADELILLKSANPPSRDCAELVSAGFVDQHFSRAISASLRVVNLRSEQPNEFHIARSCSGGNEQVDALS